MAFIEEGDIPAQTPAPRKRGRMVLYLLAGLAALNLAAIPIVVLIATGHIGGLKPAETPKGIAALDPATLKTPSGRTLDVHEFAGYVFEVTRIAYGTDPRLNSVTITVPGTPPRQGVFRIGDSFAGGNLRIVDISASAVVLSHQGEQQTFAVEGATVDEVWGRQQVGLQMIPPRNQGAIPDLPVGRVQAPVDPRASQPMDGEADDAGDEDTEEGMEGDEGRIPEGTAIEDMPVVYPPVLLRRSEFQTLMTTLHDIIEDDFVFGQAIDPETWELNGARVLNLRKESLFAVHGMRAGDDIVLLNDLKVARPADIFAHARTVSSADELRIVAWRGEERHVFTFVRSTASE